MKADGVFQTGIGMSMYELSLAICTYNRAPFLKVLIESLDRQLPGIDPLRNSRD